MRPNIPSRDKDLVEDQIFAFNICPPGDQNERIYLVHNSRVKKLVSISHPKLVRSTSFGRGKFGNIEIIYIDADSFKYMKSEKLWEKQDQD